jgi:hypothetical protein
MVKALVASIMAVSLAVPAQAALVTLRFKLIATDFLPDGAPVDPVRGRFDLLFDNSNDIESTTAGLAVTGFNIPIVPRFSYSKFYDDIVIGNDILPGGCAVANNKDDFCFFIYPISPPCCDNLLLRQQRRQRLLLRQKYLRRFGSRARHLGIDDCRIRSRWGCVAAVWATATSRLTRPVAAAIKPRRSFEPLTVFSIESRRVYDRGNMDRPADFIGGTLLSAGP